MVILGKIFLGAIKMEKNKSKVKISDDLLDQVSDGVDLDWCP